MFTITKILLPIDFSEGSDDAADAATAVAERFHSEITLLHVLDPRFEVTLATSDERTVINRFVGEEAKERMKEFRYNEWHRLEVKRVLREGDPARMIVEYAESEPIDLIVMPTHGYGPFWRLLLGSVTAKVLHDVKCPVWTTVHNEEKPPHMPGQPSRIACAVDLESHRSRENVLRWARWLSREFGVPLTIIHVTELDPPLIGDPRAELTELLQAEGINGEIYIEVGSIPDAVVERTRKERADLLVIGRSDYGGVTGRLPTNAYAIIRNAPCPVLGV